MRTELRLEVQIGQLTAFPSSPSRLLEPWLTIVAVIVLTVGQIGQCEACSQHWTAPPWSVGVEFAASESKRARGWSNYVPNR